MAPNLRGPDQSITDLMHETDSGVSALPPREAAFQHTAVPRGVTLMSGPYSGQFFYLLQMAVERIK